MDDKAETVPEGVSEAIVQATTAENSTPEDGHDSAKSSAEDIDDKNSQDKLVEPSKTELQNHVDHNLESVDNSTSAIEDEQSKETKTESEEIHDQDLKQDEEEEFDINEPTKMKEESPEDTNSQESQEVTSQEVSQDAASQEVSQDAPSQEVSSQDDPSQEVSQDAPSHDFSQDPDAPSQDFSQDTPSQEVSQDVPSQDFNQDNPSQEVSQDAASQEDDIEKPVFETAPNVSMDDSQEDHSQALDPFDALLKDTSTMADSNTPSHAESVINAEDDDHNADASESHTDNADDHPDETTIDDTSVTELEDEPGADEEVCLLPDTEREISEADKAEAAKVLAEKKKMVEDAAIPKEEVEAVETEKEIEDEQVNIDDATETTDTDVAADVTQENGSEKEVDSQVEKSQDTNNEQSAVTEIVEISGVTEKCVQCTTEASCSYRYQNKDGETTYLCSDRCLKKLQMDYPGQFVRVRKDFTIEEITPRKTKCSECEEFKVCYFYYKYDGLDTFYCSMSCLESMMGDEKSKYIFRRRRISMEEIEPKDSKCTVCDIMKKCTFMFSRYGEQHYVCDPSCIKQLNILENGRYMVRHKRPSRKTAQPTPPLLKLKVRSNATDKYLDEAYKIQAKTPAMVQAAREERERTFMRSCAQCTLILNMDDKMLTWETMDFCNEICLGRYQNKIGARCANCKNNVLHTSLGKYCVRFGYDIRQFCNSGCLEEFKKGLKICCYCQRDISAGHQGFLAPVGDKGQFKDFCSQNCMEKFDQMSKNPVPQPVWAKCAVCSLEKATNIEVEVAENTLQRLCSDPCFAAFKFVNNVCPDQCRWCKKYFERKQNKNYTIYENTTPHCFCSKSCMNVYISNSRHIVPCNWCKVKKYNFDMIRRNQPNAQPVMMCSLNCLNLYQVSVNAVSSRRIKCDMCKRTSLAQYHLTMSDATVRNFCTYQCVMSFQGQYSKHAPPLMAGGEPVDQPKAVPTGAPRRTSAVAQKNNNKGSAKGQQRTNLPVISNVQSLAAPPPLMPSMTRAKSKRLAQTLPPAEPEPPQAPKTPPPPPKPPTPPPPPPPKIYNHVIVKTLPPKEVANKGTMSKPLTVSKGVSCRPHPCNKECQTDSSLERRVLIPVPVPIYVPVPCAMWSLPFPVPVPIPIPIPTPVFIPTTRNSAKGIMKEISKIHDKMPTDPFEAELLMMAEMVAGDKKKDQSDSDTDDDNAPDEGFSPVAAIDGNNAFGEDMLQMALKMATEYEDQPVDLESAMTANTITPSSHPGMPGLEGENMHHHMMALEQQRAVAALRASNAGAGRKRGAPPQPATTRASTRSKRRRAEPPPPPEPPREPAEKPDANMCLKYTFGVNAWKQWVMTKNAEIEKSSVRRKPFKSEILQLTADELNYSLCLFVKEVRKPNGSEYAPDTIYYLVLGIQQYLFENGRIDNIFTDPYYEKFTDCLDEVARKFSVLYNDSQYIVTRVEEEHLWESKQLGAHSPHVLLSTLMFFNTKHFNLVTVEEHMQLSFSHIMKHWKRNPNQPGQAKIPGSRNVLLRFYPPQSALEANSRKKKVYEQQENEENPLRCPVKLYEFYISKCPESVRTRNDVFYLQPERSCVPDSPVWYSTQPLGRAALSKMLHRVKMVKEINIALLTS